MSEQPSTTTLSGHLVQLTSDLDDVVAMLTVHHDDGGDVHPEALPKAVALRTSLKDIIDALTKHEHLAMTSEDVWGLLSTKHKEQSSGIS